MATPNAKFLITELDFDGIKLALKNFLRAQDTFTDYDFDGSGLSILLDTLSFNTHYLAYYLNAIANEMFMDSASLRSSVVSIAKQLGYTPVSRHAATATVNLVIRPSISNPPAKITIDKFTAFGTVVDGTSYTFLTNQAYSGDLDVTSNTYTVDNVELKEGQGFTFQYTVDLQNSNQRFVIPNSNVDTTTLTVRVQASSTNTAVTVFNLADDVNGIDNTSNVYFLQETEDGQYEVYFGDGVIGSALADQNIVILQYIACNADTPNGATTFTAVSAVGGFTNVSVTTTDNAFGGEERQSTDSIKFEAPKNYQAQNRAVTAQDYATILKRDYPNADSLAIWGGEDNDPPTYGKVFISLKPKSGFVITEATKQAIITDILKPMNVVTVIPEIIDPDYIFVEVNSVVKFDTAKTTLTGDAIKALVLNTINNYNDTDISKFDSYFRFSVLSRDIDNTETSITNNLTTIKAQKRFVPTLDVFQNITLSFNTNNAITPGTITSSKFVVTQDNTYSQAFQAGDVFGFDDDGIGNVRVYKQSGSTKVVVKPIAGSINYATGTISITNFLPHSVVDPSGIIKVSAVPVSNDVITVRNNIIVIDPIDVTVTMFANPTVLT